MTEAPRSAAEVRGVVVARLRDVAPEVDADTLRDAMPLRKQVDLDSMDWLVFLVGLHDEFHIDIPEADYKTLVTLADIVGYLTARGAG